MRRYRHQDTARRLLPDEAVASCMRAPLTSAVTVKETAHGGMTYGSVTRCGSVWHCPICSAAISARRAEELQMAVRAWLGTPGRSVLLLTLTTRHSRDDALPVLLGDFLAAEKAFKQGRAYRALRKQLQGFVRALEVTHGEANGWHPHSHLLLFCKSPENEAMAAVETVREAWYDALIKVGRDCTHVGFDVRSGDAAADYVAKFGHEPADAASLWGAPQEMILAHHKAARIGGRNPWQMLADAAGGDRRAGMLFREYAETFKGRRQLVWTRGLKAFFGVDDVDDDELAGEMNDGPGPVLAIITKPDWSAVCRSRLRGLLLLAAEHEGVNGVERILAMARARADNMRPRHPPASGPPT